MKVQTFNNRRLSVLQSALAEHLRAGDPAVAEPWSAAGHPHMQAVVRAGAVYAHPRGGTPAAAAPSLAAPQDPVDICAKAVVDFLFGKLHDRARAAIELHPFGVCDIGWLEVLTDYLKHIWIGGKIPYIPPQSPTDAVFAIPERCRIGITGDWGTGTDDAMQVLRRVGEFRDALPDVPFMLLHLGDVYYSGTVSEYARFVEQSRAVFPSEPIFTMSGNHDMYAGGKPYYDTIAHLNAAPFVQHTSFFCLRNANWQLQAMDTGLHDRDPFEKAGHLTYLDPAEVTWQQQQLATADSRKVVVLSHHQPFSAFCSLGQESGNPTFQNARLLSVFNGAKPDGDGVNYLPQIVLWLFGHEHNSIFYKEYLGVHRPRCIGSSAMPATADEHPYTVADTAIPWDSTRTLSIHDNAYCHGYAIMDIDGSEGEVSYYQFPEVDGKELLYQEPL